MQRSSHRVIAKDGASAALELFVPDGPVHRALFWLPALGVGIGPNVRLATALAEAGIAVAVLEWRGLGSSSVRATRACDWNYATLLDGDIPAAIHTARGLVPGVDWYIGGHSLGGQFALIEAARSPDTWRGAMLVGSGQPYWRAFGGWRALAVRAFLQSVPLVTAARGYFPGTRLRFAGNEARGLMNDWAMTSRRGDYAVAGFGDRIDLALRAYAGSVLAVRFAHDWLAPEASLAHMRALTPAATWTTSVLGADDFAHRRADHFGWLRQPEAVVAAVRTWLGG